MNNEILNKIEVLRPNQVYGVTREDGQIISVTDDVNNIPDMISEEYCGVEVKLVNLTYNKQPMNYTLEVEVDDDGELFEQEFTIATVPYYATKKHRDTMINWAEGLYTPFTFTDEDKQDLIDDLNDL